MIEISGSSWENKILMVDRSFNEDFKNIIFSRQALISEEGRVENLGKMGYNREIYCYANQGWSISKENISPYSLVPNSL